MSLNVSVIEALVENMLIRNNPNQYIGSNAPFFFSPQSYFLFPGVISEEVLCTSFQSVCFAFTNVYHINEFIYKLRYLYSQIFDFFFLILAVGVRIFLFTN